jgi:transcriptional regulator with XRE-family HTH domain
MKNINKIQKNIDPIAEARGGKYFKQYSREAKERIKLGVEIYNAREISGMSQQKLAKQAKTTQKVISRIENGDVNVGFSLLNRIASVLSFNYENWSNILGFSVPYKFLFIGSKTANNTTKIRTNSFACETYNLLIR